jgi:quercetin dioxygenase-like cupin family protein
MKQRRRVFLLIAGVSLGGMTMVAVGPAKGEEPPKMPPRQVLLQKEVDLAAPRITANVIRVSFPKGYKTPLHTHEGPGPRYVLKGNLKVEDGGASHVYGPGDVFWESGREMTVENVGSTEAEMVIFEMLARK